MSEKSKRNSQYQIAAAGDLKLAADADLIDDLPNELSDRQVRIVKYRMRGLTQKAIAQLEDVSQPMIAKEVRAIRQIFANAGRQIDQDVVVGTSLNFYQEVQKRGWELYHKALNAKVPMIGDANKSLGTVMAAHERSLKLLMDLGLIKRAAIEHNHTVAPFLEKWEQQSPEEKQIVVQAVIDTQLSKLEEPEPPKLTADIIDINGEEKEED